MFEIRVHPLAHGSIKQCFVTLSVRVSIKPSEPPGKTFDFIQLVDSELKSETIDEAKDFYQPHSSVFFTQINVLHFELIKCEMILGVNANVS